MRDGHNLYVIMFSFSSSFYKMKKTDGRKRCVRWRERERERKREKERGGEERDSERQRQREREGGKELKRLFIPIFLYFSLRFLYPSHLILLHDSEFIQLLILACFTPLPLPPLLTPPIKKKYKKKKNKIQGKKQNVNLLAECDPPFYNRPEIACKAAPAVT